jgi:hypothetical protein
MVKENSEVAFLYILHEIGKEEYRLWLYNRVLRRVFESKERVTAG